MQTRRAGYARLRIGRHSERGRCYLVTFTTHRRHPLFTDLWTARAAAIAFAHPTVLKGSRLRCWVLMPDHAHLVLELADADTLAKRVQALKAAAARNVRQIRGSSPVWSAGFHDRAVRANEDLRRIARYVIANPVRAGLVERAGDYPHWDADWLDEAGSPVPDCRNRSCSLLLLWERVLRATATTLPTAELRGKRLVLAASLRLQRLRCRA